MKMAVVAHRDAILRAVWDEIGDVFDAISPQIAEVAPASVADIGSGQAFIDLLIYRRIGCDLVLVDIEDSEALHFGFAATGAGYADLANARAFLTANGVPDSAIRTLNPRKDGLEDVQVDMAISLLSCGFHYPVATYDAFFRRQVRRAILLDCRRQRKSNQTALGQYGSMKLVAEGRKSQRFLCTKEKGRA